MYEVGEAQLLAFSGVLVWWFWFPALALIHSLIYMRDDSNREET